MHPLSGRKQSAEHIRNRMAAVAATKAKWTDEQKSAYAAKVAAANCLRSEEFRQRFAKCNLGKPSPNKGKKYPQISGENHHMFGKSHSPEAIEKMRAAKVGRKQSALLVKKRIAARCGYRHSLATRQKIRTTNIKTWERDEVRAKVSGENSPTWLGGKSFEPYPMEWTNALKQSIRKRDNFCCRACGKPEDENGQRLCIHHVDYNKENLHHSNLVSVCKSCHGKTNYNRTDWQYFFNRNSR